MTVIPRRLSAAALAVALLALPGVAYAQDAAPTRQANVWNGQHHQPTESDVQQKEKAAGVAPTQSRQDQQAATVHTLNRRLGGCATPNCP
jgi:hypothetical protein